MENLVTSQGILIIGIDNAKMKVNVLGKEMLRDIERIVSIVNDNDKIQGAVLVSLKNNPPSFIAGADINEINAITSEEECRTFVIHVNHLFDKISQSPKPFVAAIEGVCLGGGLELALACHWRVASTHPNTVLALPEVKLGIIPGFGGTQRLPKLIGLLPALEMITTGKSVFSKKAVNTGLIDDLVEYVKNDTRDITTIVEEPFVKIAIQRALELSNGKIKRMHRRGILNKIAVGPLVRNIISHKAKKQVEKATGGRYPAPALAVEAVMEGLHTDILEGCLSLEVPKVTQLAVSAVSKNLINVFLETEKIKQIKTGGLSLNPAECRVGVIGAGLMGSQIAANLVEAGFETTLKDINGELLRRGLNRIIGFHSKDLERRVITRREFDERLLRIEPVVSWDSFKNNRLLIEAAAEILTVKRQLLKDYEDMASGDAIFATNTSSFTVAEIAQNARVKDRCIAMHFFNPLRAMKLVEIGVAKFTSQDTINRTVSLAKLMGKLPLVVKDCPGFLVNRILSRYLIESIILLSDGILISDIDGAAKKFGMAIDSGKAMGPLELLDYIGIETGVHVIESLKKLGPRIESRPFIHGMATRKLSFWNKGRQNEALYALLKENYGWQRISLDQKTITDRLMLPMIDEALRCLAEGIVDDPNKIDLAMLYGAGFPAFTGGMLKWAREKELHKINHRLNELSDKYGERFRPFSD